VDAVCIREKWRETRDCDVFLEEVSAKTACSIRAVEPGVTLGRELRELEGLKVKGRVIYHSDDENFWCHGMAVAVDSFTIIFPCLDERRCHTDANYREDSHEPGELHFEKLIKE
jgi:hypothetical protein